MPLQRPHSRRVKERTHAVPNVFNGNLSVSYLGYKVGGDFQSEKVDYIFIKFSAGRLKCLSDSVGDFTDIKINNFSVSFDNLVHVFSLSSITVYIFVIYTPRTCTAGT